MLRLDRAVAVGFAHHITQRGNNRDAVFFVDDDRRVYLQLLKEQADKYGLEMVAGVSEKNKKNRDSHEWHEDKA